MKHVDYNNVNKALEGVLAVADFLEAARAETENVNMVNFIIFSIFFWNITK